MKWGKKALVVLVILGLCFVSFSSVFVGESEKVESANAQVNVSMGLSVGQKVEVYGTQPHPIIYVRSLWGTTSSIIGEKYWGSTGTIIDGPQYANGYTWWKVQWDNNENVSDPYNKPQLGWTADVCLWNYDTDMRVRGVDVSHHNSITSWYAVYQSGRRFALIKASESTYFEDPKLPDNVPSAYSAGMLVSVYHLGRPDANPTIDGACSEADWFVDVAGNYLTTDYLRPTLDLEKTNGDWSSLASWVHAWMEEVKLKAHLTSYPILYCSKSYANELYSHDSTITKYPLWIVDFNNSYSPDTCGWSSWSFRQYAGDINAVLGTAGRCPGFANDTGVDLDIYNGDINSLRSNFLIQTSTVVPPTITVTSPNGGETWNVGETRSITWTVSGDTSHIDHFILNYGTDGSYNQYYIATTSSTSISYSWTTIPNTPSTQCKVGIWVMDASNNILASNSSNNFFTIAQQVIGEPKSIHTWLNGPNDNDIYNYDIDFKIDTWLINPDPNWLYFWAICVYFSDEQGVSKGAAHGGLQWASGSKKANWGGYELVGGTQSIVINYNWEPGKWYRYRVWGLGQNADGSYNWGFWILDYETNVETCLGSVTSWGKYINDICVFTETGYGVSCNTPTVQVRWKNPLYKSFTREGSNISPTSGYATYNGTCSDPNNTDQRLISINPIEFIHLTNTNRITPNNSNLFEINQSPSITTSSPLPSGTQNQYYSTSFSATGGTTPYTWSKTSGTFPSGLSLSSSGVLSGTPTNYEDFSFTIQVSDSGGRTGSKSFSLHITQYYPSVVPLSNNVPVANLSDTYNGKKYFSINVPSVTLNLTIKIYSGTGDADLYVRYGDLPTLDDWDYRPYLYGNNETVSINNPVGGDWYIMIHAYDDYSGVTLLASYTTASSGKDDIGVYRPSTVRFYFRASNGSVTSMHFGTTGDLPIIGDWNGDGIDDIGVFRPSTVRFYFRAPNGSVTSMHFGTTGDMPIIGKWEP